MDKCRLEVSKIKLEEQKISSVILTSKTSILHISHKCVVNLYLFSFLQLIYLLPIKQIILLLKVNESSPDQSTNQQTRHKKEGFLNIRRDLWRWRTVETDIWTGHISLFKQNSPSSCSDDDNGMFWSWIPLEL